jgi:exosome complex RNA-binding protein Csl4
MAHTKAQLKIRVKLESGPRVGEWVYCPIARAKNKSIKVQWAMVDGKEEQHKEGVYTLFFRQNGKQCKETVEAVQDLLAKAVKDKVAELDAIAKGHKTIEVKAKEGRKGVQVDTG